MFISLDVAGDSGFFTRRMFDVSNMLVRISELESHRLGKMKLSTLRLKRSQSSGGIFRISPQLGGGGLGAGPQKTVPGADPEVVLTAEDLLVDTITQFVDPSGWYITNGEGTAKILGGILIVHQSEEACNEVARFLKDLGYQLSQRQAR